jgi:hypothetical protein
MLHSSSPLKFVIIDTTKISKHRNVGFISLKLLTEVVFNCHTETFSESMEGRAFETCLLPTELITLLLTLIKLLLLWWRWPAHTRNFSKSQNVKMVDWGRGYGATTPSHLGLCAPPLVPPIISRGAPRQVTWETSVSEERNWARNDWSIFPAILTSM